MERALRLYPHAPNVWRIPSGWMARTIQTSLRVSFNPYTNLLLRHRALISYLFCNSALEPGGWIEQMELDVRVYSDDGTLKEEHQLYGWGDMFIRCSERAGRSLRTHETMRSAIEEAGFVDVHEEKYKIPIGPWARDNALKEAGHLQYGHWNAALEGWAMWLLTHFGEPVPWSKEEVHVFLAKVRTELSSPHIHAYEPA
jgi:hypothetical protein